MDTPLSTAPEVVKALQGLESSVAITVVICMAVLGAAGLATHLIASYINKRSEAKEKKQIAEIKTANNEANRKSLADLTAAIHASIKLQEVTSQSQADQHAAYVAELKEVRGAVNRMAEGVTELSNGIRTLVANSKGVLNPEESRRLITDEMKSLCKETIRVFQYSLRKNHFKGHEREISDKMREELARVIDHSITKLRTYNLAVDVTNYYEEIKLENGSIRYTLIDKIWEEMVKLYKTPVNYADHELGKTRDTIISSKIKAIFRDAIMSGDHKCDRAYHVDSHSDMTPPRNRSKSGEYDMADDDSNRTLISDIDTGSDTEVLVAVRA